MISNQKQLEVDHPKKDAFVFKFFKEASEDINRIFQKYPGKDYDLAPLRVQMIAIFTLLDVAANYWYEYLGDSEYRVSYPKIKSTGSQRERFTRWCNKYCFTKRNNEYNGDLRKIDSEQFYEFRSSMVHFFGLGRKINGRVISLIDNSLGRPKHREMQRFFRKKAEDSVLILKTKKLHNFVIEGVITMFEKEWAKVIEDSRIDESKKWKHIEGIDRVYQKIFKEGAMTVFLEKNPK